MKEGKTSKISSIVKKHINLPVQEIIFDKTFNEMSVLTHQRILWD